MAEHLSSYLVNVLRKIHQNVRGTPGSFATAILGEHGYIKKDQFTGEWIVLPKGLELLGVKSDGT